MWFLPGVALVTLAGWAIAGWLGGTRNAIERLGASMLLGLGLVTMSMFFWGLVGAPIAPVVYLPPVAIVAVEGARTAFLAVRSARGTGVWRRFRALGVPRHLLFIAPALLLIGVLLLVVGARGWLLPNRFYDSLTTFDLLGKVIAAEGVFRVSLFEHTNISRGGSYPPFTALFFAFAYDMGATSMTRSILVPYGAFVLWIFGFARRWMGATSAYWLLAVCLVSPDFNSFLQLPLTQLPVAAFAGGALVYLHAALGATDAAPGIAGRRRALAMSAVFLVLATWTRADAGVFVLGAWLAVLVYGRGRVPMWTRLAYGVPAVGLTLAWQAYAANVLGESGAGRFVEHLFWDWPRMRYLLVISAQLLLAAPQAFGLAGLALVVALVSHATARRAVGPLALATVLALVVYTLMYYQVDPDRQDPLPALMRSSYRRGVTAFILPMWMIFLISPVGVWGRRVLGRMFGRRRLTPRTS